MKPDAITRELEKRLGFRVCLYGNGEYIKWVFPKDSHLRMWRLLRRLMKERQKWTKTKP